MEMHKTRLEEYAPLRQSIINKLGNNIEHIRITLQNHPVLHLESRNIKDDTES